MKIARASPTDVTTSPSRASTLVCRRRNYKADDFVLKGPAGSTYTPTTLAHIDATEVISGKEVLKHVLRPSIRPPPTPAVNTTGTALPFLGGGNSMGNTVRIAPPGAMIPSTINPIGIKEHRKETPRLEALMRPKALALSTLPTESPGTPMKLSVSTT